MEPNDSFSALADALKVAVAALREAGIPFALAGGFAAWARGAPPPGKDLDLVVKPADAEAALDALARAGMRVERPPEEWLYKAFHDGAMLDLIFRPAGLEVDDAVLERADALLVLGLTIPVLPADDILTTRLMALTEQGLDYTGILAIARALREQIDWPALYRRTCRSPLARAFFTMAEGLRISEPQPSGGQPRRVRVVGTPDLD